MPEDLPLKPGWAPDLGVPYRGTIRVIAWEPPLFAAYDEDLGARLRLAPLPSIMVERRVSTTAVRHAVVRWTHTGTGIGTWERQKMPLWLRRRIERAIRETLRIAGGSMGTKKKTEIRCL